MDVIFAAESAVDESLRGKASARLLNMYPEKGGDRSPVTIRGVPGLIEQGTLGTGRVRAMISASDGLYAAVGGQFVRWDGTTTTVLGTLPDGATTMARNRSQIGITAGGNYYVWNGTALSGVSGGAFSSFGSVTYLDNFMVLNQKGGEAYQYSEAGDAGSIDPLDFSSAETSPDDLVRIVAVNGMLWMLGADSVEAWRNAGALDNPFRRISELRMEKGLRSASEVVLLDNTFMFVSNEGRVYRQELGRPVNVSSNAVAASLKLHTEAVGFSYQFNNHDFLCLRFGDRPAWIYDPSTQKWHERSTGPTHQPWEVTATVQHDGVWYAGTDDGALCTFGGYQDRGEELRRDATSALLMNGGERFTISKADIRMEGAGTVMVRKSNDGRTFSDERQRTFGGSYGERLTLRGMGQYREFCLNLACTDNTEFAIHSASIN